MTIKILLFKVKKGLSVLRPKRIKKLCRVLKKDKPYHKELVSKLRKLKIKILKKFSLETWKWYGDNHVRMTYLVKIGGKKYVLKATKGFEQKSQNSIAFQKLFNNKFDFIPKGYDILVDGYLVSVTEFIKSYSFNEAVAIGSVNEKNIDIFLEQIVDILNQLDAENIVHCDMAAVNLLVEQRTNKLFVIDWDTVCSMKYNLVSDAFPHNSTTQPVEGGFMYDDAYALSILFKSLNIRNIETDELFKKIEEKIGKNVFIAKY